MGNNVLVGSRAIPPYQTLGDRLKQIADGVTTDYTLDINAGLTQVLQDNTNKYVYGNSRIAQIAETQTGYFLPDALGSMRQMTDPSADLTLARTYDPYGNVVSSSGAGETVYGYTGEVQSGGLVHLRARDYASQLGRFTSRDTWGGKITDISSFNKWLYADANPLNKIDPTGYYDRTAAINFAFTHDQDDKFPDDGYYAFPEYPDKQCTIFVSSAMSVGGYPISKIWPGYENSRYELYGFPSEEDFIESAAKEGNYYTAGPWIQAQALFDYLKNNNMVFNPPHNNPKENDPVDFSSADWKEWIGSVGSKVMQGDLVFYTSQNNVEYLDSNFGHVAMVIGWGLDTNRYNYFSFDRTYECAKERFINNLFFTYNLRPLVVERSGLKNYSFARAIDDTVSTIRKISIIHIVD